MTVLHRQLRGGPHAVGVFCRDFGLLIHQVGATALYHRHAKSASLPLRVRPRGVLQCSGVPRRMALFQRPHDDG